MFLIVWGPCNVENAFHLVENDVSFAGCMRKYVILLSKSESDLISLISFRLYLSREMIEVCYNKYTVFQKCHYCVSL